MRVVDAAALDSLEHRVGRFLQTPYDGACACCQLAREHAAWAILVEWSMMRDEDRATFLLEHGEDQFSEALLAMVDEATVSGHDVAGAAAAERH